MLKGIFVSEKKQYELDFEEYIRNSEPNKKDKTYAWTTAIGLQQVDKLTPSKQLYDIAKRNIDGKISIKEATAIIDTYYKLKTVCKDNNLNRTEEADKVSLRIAQILSENSFNFSPSYLLALHARLFDAIFEFAGKIRDYDISKKEWVLDNDSVIYGAAFELRDALNYDFEQERKFSYKNLSMDEIVKHITFFVSKLWQIHPFGEGNTRTTAVFIIKYLRTLGFKVDNDIFAKNSWYFRNALVRANYNNLKKGIRENTEYLEKFFRNLLLDEHNELKNRYLHVRCKKDKTIKVGTLNDTLNGTLKNKLLNIIKEQPAIKQTDIAIKLNVSLRTIKRIMKTLQDDRIIERTGSKKAGHWKIK